MTIGDDISIFGNNKARAKRLSIVWRLAIILLSEKLAQPFVQWIIVRQRRYPQARRELRHLNLPRGADINYPGRVRFDQTGKVGQARLRGTPGAAHEKH